MKKRFLKNFLSIFFAFLLGIIISVVVLQEDPWVKEKLELAICKSISKIIEADFTCKVRKINIFSGYFSLDSVKAYSKNCKKSDEWSFSISEIVFNVTLLDFLTQSKASTHVICNKLFFSSAVCNKQCAIFEPIKKFLASPSILPVEINSVTIYDSGLVIKDYQYNHKARIGFSGSLLYSNRLLRANIITNSGELVKDKHAYLKNINGPITCKVLCDVASNTYKLSNAQVNVSLDIVKNFNNINNNFNEACKSEHCKFTGTLKEKGGHFRIHNINHTLISNIIVDKIEGNKYKLTFNAHVPLNLFDHYLDSSIKGIGIIQGRALWDLSGITSTFYITVNGLKYNNYLLGDARLKISSDCNKIKVSVQSFSTPFPIECVAQWSIKNAKGTCIFNNTQEYALGSLVIIPKKELKVVIDCDKSLDLKTSINLKLYNKLHKKYLDLKGSIVKTKNNLIFDGFLDKYHIKARSNLNTLTLASLSCDKLLIFENNTTKISYDFIKDFLKEFGVFLPIGQGDFIINNINTDNPLDEDVIALCFKLENANIKIPNMYNAIKGVEGRAIINFKEKTVTVKDLKIIFYKGTASSKEIKLWFDENYNLTYAHIPLVISQLFFNYQKNVLGLLTGMLTFCYNPYIKNKVDGYLFIDRVHVRGADSSFSTNNTDFYKILANNITYNYNADLNVSLKSRTPIEIEASLIKASAHLDIYLFNTLMQPKCTGTVTLNEGKLLFPYKPLFITSGKITLYSQALENSQIDIMAHNAIKKYNVLLSVNGTLENPVVSLTSSPPLREEQIVTLLLAGTEEGSLYMAMPHIIMQTLEKLLFNNNKESSVFQRSLKSLIRPLKNVRIIPRISNIHSSGNVKGSLEFDINDRLRALVQNNLNFSENTHVEVEYMLTDDVSVKGVKDPQGSLEAELEMKWKF